MAALGRMISSLAVSTWNTVKSTPIQQVCGQCKGLLNGAVSPWQPTSQVRTRYLDWRMWRDVKRRRLTREHGQERIRYVALKRNTIIPAEIRETLTKDIEQKFPRDANPTRIVDRCMMTSRGRGVQRRWRLSRIMWRHLADYNQLSGVTRARW